MNEFLSFVLGSVAVPVFLYFLAKINPNTTALMVISFLEKIFKDTRLRNIVSNALGVRLAIFGISLITAIEDEETIKKRVDVILTELSELLIQISRKEA